MATFGFSGLPCACAASGNDTATIAHRATIRWRKSFIVSSNVRSMSFRAQRGICFSCRALLLFEPRLYRSGCTQPCDVFIVVADALQHLVGVLSERRPDPVDRAGRVGEL